MRTVVKQLLALGMCFGLFAVTCPLAAQTATATASPRSNQKCCAKGEVSQPCCGTERSEEEEPSGCCVSHYCGNVISAAAAPVSAFRADALGLIFTYAQRIVVRPHAPPVPPPRIAFA